MSKFLKLVLPIFFIAVVLGLVFFFLQDSEERGRTGASADTPVSTGKNSTLRESSDPRKKLTPEELESLRARVTGMVLAGDTDAPVVGARVWGEVDRADSYPWKETTRARRDGSYRLDPIFPGDEETVVVRASAPSFLEQKKTVVVRAGEVAENVNFRLTDNTDVRIWVFEGTTTRPVTNAHIDLGRDREKKLIDVKSDGSGLYVAENLKKGRYRIVISAPGFQPLFHHIDVARSEQEFRFGLSDAGGLKGLISNVAGDPVSNATVVYRHAGGLMLSNSSGNDGKYYIDGLGPGEGEVSVSHTSYAFVVGGTVEIEPGRWTTKNMVLENGVEMFGMLQDASGEPVNGAVIWLKQGYYHTAWSKRAVTDNGGNYTFEQVAAGEYRAIVEAEGYMTFEERGIFVEPGFDRVRKDFLISRGAFVTGRVVDASGDPIPGVSVQGKQPPARTRTDENGYFKLWGLFPDRPAIVEFVPDDHGYRRFEGVKPNSDLGVVKLDSYAVLTGRVMWGDTALPGVKVVMFKKNDNVAYVRSTSDGTPHWRDGKLEPGEFAYLTLPPGEYRLEISTEGFKKKVFDNVEAPESGEVDLGVIRLTPER